MAERGPQRQLFEFRLFWLFALITTISGLTFASYPPDLGRLLSSNWPFVFLIIISLFAIAKIATEEMIRRKHGIAQGLNDTDWLIFIATLGLLEPVYVVWQLVRNKSLTPSATFQTFTGALSKGGIVHRCKICGANLSSLYWRNLGHVRLCHLSIYKRERDLVQVTTILMIVALLAAATSLTIGLEGGAWILLTISWVGLTACFFVVRRTSKAT